MSESSRMAKKVQHAGRLTTAKAGALLAARLQQTLRRGRRLYLALGGTVAAIALALGAFNLAFADKVLPGVTVGEIEAGGWTREELAAALDRRVEEMSRAQLTVAVGDKEFRVDPYADWHLSYDIERTVEEAMAVGRGRSLVASLGEQLATLAVGRPVPVRYRLNHRPFRRWLARVREEAEVPERDARLVINEGSLAVEPEQTGQRLPPGQPETAVRQTLETLRLSDPITLTLAPAAPAVTQPLAEAVVSEVGRMVLSDLTLTFQDRRLVVGPAELLGLVELAADSASPERAAAVVNRGKVIGLLEGIARQIDQDPVDARLTIAGGRATVFTPSRDGYRVNREEAATAVAEALAKRRTAVAVATVELPVTVTKPAVRTETINDLGIRELIGRATTSFAGSPPNRIHNITVGARSFHGLLIKPGETFSTLAALGNIDESNGYRAELVIKEDRLIPETGGGLCQVSTTLFRAVLNAGLPIAERRNHSFRVRYYEPPIGMDATIYDPAPDLKFTNDTPGYILIQTKVEGTRITFELYGTKDGREVVLTDPVVYNVTQPGDPVYIEDPSLAPGEVRQIEKAVPGASARFTYTVRKDGQILHQKTFTSHYVAWRAKYLVGPQAPPAPAEPPPPPPT